MYSVIDAFGALRLRLPVFISRLALAVVASNYSVHEALACHGERKNGGAASYV
ncbi:hypothetical protein PISMIDRAFT_669960 [Pisolithus microcarpus 441]|uniref:Unplaced genomic scaffold scaffold_1, whole genome shotgun sequence n=1 Tax=Pisolithus microcarpus 441 TaxID=765257 RepID=A0A0D0AG25_9AGAM|nr:hypothetical protein PISMIDRAFT_669960 [Pisolithus microcarpus 441]